MESYIIKATQMRGPWWSKLVMICCMQPPNFSPFSYLTFLCLPQVISRPHLTFTWFVAFCEEWYQYKVCIQRNYVNFFFGSSIVFGWLFFLQSHCRIFRPWIILLSLQRAQIGAKAAQHVARIEGRVANPGSSFVFALVWVAIYKSLANGVVTRGGSGTLSPPVGAWMAPSLAMTALCPLAMIHGWLIVHTLVYTTIAFIDAVVYWWGWCAVFAYTWVVPFCRAKHRHALLVL